MVFEGNYMPYDLAIFMCVRLSHPVANAKYWHQYLCFEPMLLGAPEVPAYFRNNFILYFQHMIYGGTDEPCGLADFMCIGKMGVEENKKVKKNI